MKPIHIQCSTILLNKIRHFELSLEHYAADVGFLHLFIMKAKLKRNISIGKAEKGRVRLAPKESFCEANTERVGQEIEGAELICICTCLSALDEFSVSLRSNWSSLKRTGGCRAAGTVPPSDAYSNRRTEIAASSTLYILRNRHRRGYTTDKRDTQSFDAYPE